MAKTHALNFVPDEFVRERIEKAARGNRDTLIDLAFLNISYDEEQHGWVLVNEPADSLKALKECALAGARRSTEPRFRVWDNQSQLFADEALCCVGADGSLYVEGLKQDRSRYVVEHATGQIDKNSTEVYIGDIILCQYTWFGCPTRDIYLVKWDNYGRILPFHHIFHSGRELWIELFAAKIEVIGNIHQHPHQEIPPDGWHSDLGRLPYV